LAAPRCFFLSKYNLHVHTSGYVKLLDSAEQSFWSVFQTIVTDLYKTMPVRISHNNRTTLKAWTRFIDLVLVHPPAAN
jgi:hypothetical protein